MKSDAKQHILILGVTGFIGSAFFNELKCNSKSIHFHILLRKEKVSLKESSNCSIYYGNLETFNWSLLKAIPNFVYHFARINSTKWRSVGRMMSAFKGRKANKRLLNYLNENAPSCTLYYLSGSLMYGNSDQVIVEGNKLNPISFARQYKTAENPFVKNQKLKKSIKTCMVRVPWVLGDGSWFKGFYKDYILKNKHVPIYGEGDNMMSFITLVELAEYLRLLMELDFHQTIHISYSQFISQLEFAQLISKHRNLPLHQMGIDKHEKSINEAFTSNILLSSRIRELSVSQEELDYKLNTQLTLIFKDV
jgi:nucleoside-diphosphate-sugar epimerase